MIGAWLLIQTLLLLQQGEKYHTHSSLLISFSRMKKIWTTVDWSEVISELKAPKITHIKCCIHANVRKTNRKLCSITKWIYNYSSFYSQYEIVMLIEFSLLISLHSTLCPHSVVHRNIVHPFISFPSPSGPKSPPLDEGCIEDLPWCWSWREGRALGLFLPASDSCDTSSLLLHLGIVPSFSSLHLWSD